MPEPQYTLFPNTAPNKKSARPPRSQRVRDYDARRRKTPKRKAAAKEWVANNNGRMKMVSRVGHMVARALKSGQLVKPSACEECGAIDRDLQGAHSDYAKPLDVRWLCSPCHSRWDQLEPKTLTIVPPTYGRKDHDTRTAATRGCSCGQCKAYRNEVARRGRQAKRDEQKARGLPVGFRTKAIGQFDLSGALIREWNSLSDAARSFGKKTSGISNCLKGDARSAHGFVWKYSNAET